MMTTIHPTALVSEAAQLGEGVVVGPYSIIHGNAHIGANTVIGSHCEIGIETPLATSDELIIGEGSLIRSHSVFYQGSRFGARLVTGHRVTVRENNIAGEGLQIGTASDFQGDCTFGDHVKTQSNVFIGQHATIGNCVWIFPYVVLTNDPHPPSECRPGIIIEDFASLATLAIILPGVRVGKDSLIGASTLVRSDVPERGLCVGVPGKVIGTTEGIKLRDTGKPAYPWRRHFHRGYPDSLVSQWKAEFPDG